MKVARVSNARHRRDRENRVKRGMSCFDYHPEAARFASGGLVSVQCKNFQLALVAAKENETPLAG